MTFGIGILFMFNFTPHVIPERISHLFLFFRFCKLFSFNFKLPLECISRIWRIKSFNEHILDRKWNNRSRIISDSMCAFSVTSSVFLGQKGKSIVHQAKCICEWKRGDFCTFTIIKRLSCVLRLTRASNLSCCNFRCLFAHFFALSLSLIALLSL